VRERERERERVSTLFWRRVNLKRCEKRRRQSSEWNKIVECSGQRSADTGREKNTTHDQNAKIAPL